MIAATTAAIFSAVGLTGTAAFAEQTTLNIGMASADAGSIKKAAVASGMESLRIAGARKVLQNLTSVAEVLRVSQEESMFDE